MSNPTSINDPYTKAFLNVGKMEGYSYLILLFIAMPLKYILKMPELVRITGMIHGILFILFMFLLIVMLIKTKLNLRKAALAFLLSLVPFGTFYLRRLLN